MKSTALKSFAALLACTLTTQAQPKNVLAELMSQSETKPSIISLEVEKTLVGAKKPWETSKYFSTNMQNSLQELLKVTKEQIKNPRAQKIGGLDGGGGHAQICEEKNGLTIEVLDLAEAADEGLQIDMGSGNYVQKLEYVFKRLAKIAPTYASYLASMANDLLTTDTQWVQNSAMPSVEDAKVLALKRNCTIVQVAIQRPISQKDVPNAKTYVIDKDFFSLLDDNSKAALILHEVLYRSARFSDQDDSVFARKLTAIIASEQITKHTLRTFNKMLTKNDITCLEDERLPIMYNTERSSACSYISYSSINMSAKKPDSWQHLTQDKPWQALNYSSLNGQLEYLGHYRLNKLMTNTDELDLDDEINDFMDIPFPATDDLSIAPTVFRVKGELNFFPFTTNIHVILKNGFVFVSPTESALGNSTVVAYGDVSIKSMRIVYASKNSHNSISTTILSTHLDKEGTVWKIKPNRDNMLSDHAKNYSLKVQLPNALSIPKDINGWADVIEVRFSDINKINSVTYYDPATQKYVELKDLNQLN